MAVVAVAEAETCTHWAAVAVVVAVVVVQG